MSRRNKGRDIHGMLLLDKSQGMTSNGALQRVKRLLQANKAGHTGSLDPIATGVLPLCLGEATKLSGFLLNTDKRYFTRVRLGRTTTTADCEGETLAEQPVPVLDAELIEAALQPFRGEIAQVPPMYSALKHQGRKLYELARLGEEVERQPRNICIYELRLLDFGADFLDLDVHCSKGTYIRVLAEEIGAKLGCGGHVEQLRRTAVGTFTLAQSVRFEDLELLDDAARLALLLPFSAIAEELPVFTLSASAAVSLCKGQPVSAADAPPSGLLRLFADDGAFLGVGEATGAGGIAPRRLIRQSTESV